jgi:hypothetical protein
MILKQKIHIVVRDPAQDLFIYKVALSEGASHIKFHHPIQQEPLTK